MARLSPGHRQTVLRAAADEVFGVFDDRVLAFDATAAGVGGDLVVTRVRAGRPVSGFDAQIAGVCRARRATLATRNTADFDQLDLDLVDPWTSGPGPD